MLNRILTRVRIAILSEKHWSVDAPQNQFQQIFHWLDIIQYSVKIKQNKTQTHFVEKGSKLSIVIRGTDVSPLLWSTVWHGYWVIEVLRSLHCTSRNQTQGR